MKRDAWWRGSALAVVIISAAACPNRGVPAADPGQGAPVRDFGSRAERGAADRTVRDDASARDGVGEALPDDGGVLEAGAVCTPGVSQCFCNAVRTCAPNGQWGPSVPCTGSTSFCVTGACVACVSGAAQCSGATPQSCDATGHWQEGTACGASTPFGCPGAASSCPVLLAAGHGEWAHHLAVNAVGVYWTLWKDACGAVMTVPVTGGPTFALVPDLDASPWGIVADATHVYWANQGTDTCVPGTLKCKYNHDGTVMKVSVGAGGTPVALASGLNRPGFVAVDAINVYWANGGGCNSPDGSIMKVPIGGGTPTTLASGLSEPGRLMVDASNVYWAEGGVCGPSAIKKVPIAGGPPTMLASFVGNPWAIAVDASSVYWATVDQMGITGMLAKVPIGGGAMITLASGAIQPKSMAVDAVHVYWVDGTSGAIMKVPIGGGSPAVFAAKQKAVAIAIDANTVYWTNDNGGVMSLAK